MFASRSKQSPYLSEYLDYAVHQSKVSKNEGMITMIFAGVAAGSAALLGSITNVFVHNMPLASAIVAAGCAIGAIQGMKGMRELRQRRLDPELQTHIHAREIAKTFQEALAHRKLARILHPGVADLLEQAARNWKRINDAIDGDFWTSETLPEHWKAVRKQAGDSADKGMAEILILLEGSMQLDTKPADVADGIAMALEGLGFNTNAKTKFDHLPVEFESARTLCERLGKLATEMEDASRQILQTEDVRSRLNSSRSIDDTLAELQNIRSAENELR